MSTFACHFCGEPTSPDADDTITLRLNGEIRAVEHASCFLRCTPDDIARLLRVPGTREHADDDPGADGADPGRGVPGDLGD